TTSAPCTLSLHDALPIYLCMSGVNRIVSGDTDGRGCTKSAHRLYDGRENVPRPSLGADQLRLRALRFDLPAKAPHLHIDRAVVRSEEHTSELQSLRHLVC